MARASVSRGTSKGGASPGRKVAGKGLASPGRGRTHSKLMEEDADRGASGGGFLGGLRSSMGFTWGLGQTTRQARRRERLKLRVPWPSRRSPSVACREEAGAPRGVLEATAAPPTPRTCRIFRGQCGATARLNVLRRCRGRYAAAVQARTGTARMFTVTSCRPTCTVLKRVASWTVT